MSQEGFPNKDRVELQLNGLVITLSRELSIAVPHEVSVIIPRAELRHKHVRPDQTEETCEVILNSITVVHAPRHPLAGERTPAAGPQPAAAPPSPASAGIRMLGPVIRHVGKGL